jgi:predicted nuclease of predicted toxin-antitoxin system
VRFLADMGVSVSVAAARRALGHDVVHARERGLARAPDGVLLDTARREQRVVLTFDLDFGDLLAASGARLPSVVLFRLRDQTPASVTPRLRRLLEERGQDLATGALVVVEHARYRLRRLPIGGADGDGAGDRGDRGD